MFNKLTIGQLIVVLGLFLQSSVFGYEVYSLYTPKKPYATGEIITVYITESANASNSAKTKTQVSGDQEFGVTGGVGALSGIPAMSVGSSQKSNYTGNGATSKKGELKATISVRISKVLDNGNLMIDGMKEVRVNDESEIISLSGIIRPEDIMADNSIYSYKITDARISYSGDGSMSSTEKPGVITRFFNWLF